MRRLAGDGRIDTAIAVSQDQFADGTASTVVLARADDPADALGGTALAVTAGGPLLLTPSDALPGEVAAEISRVLPTGAGVTILGGTDAISAEVQAAVEALARPVARVGGATRIETAVAVGAAADRGGPILVTTGWDHPDALAAGAAAAAHGGRVLLTTPDAPHPVVDGVLAAADVPVHAIGGPAARAYPDLDAVVGATRDHTALAVAQVFFDRPANTGLASGGSFADALAGGAHVSRVGGPLLLASDPQVLDPSVAEHLGAARPELAEVVAYGGTAVIFDALLDQVREVLTGP